MSEDTHVKVGLPLKGKGTIKSEWIWCKPVNGDSYEVCNAPALTEVCTIGDIIEAQPGKGEDTRLQFTGVVERVQQNLYMSYEVKGTTKEERQQRYKVFWHACDEHGCLVEGFTPGLLVVAVPYGKKKEMLPIVLDCALTAKLDMKEYEDV